jgi:sugar/nucleoside kinase (ribokinase family)
MNGIVIYESLTGNTRAAGQMIAAELTAAGIDTTACPITEVDLQALSGADLVVVGSWTDGVFFFGQRPGRGGRIAAKLPRIDGKKAVVYCTYALDCGQTLDKLARIVRMGGGDVIGGYAIKRNDLAGGASEFVERLLGALDGTTA